jgi:hypothetical protein
MVVRTCRTTLARTSVMERFRVTVTTYTCQRYTEQRSRKQSKKESSSSPRRHRIHLLFAETRRAHNHAIFLLACECLT